jgi:AcrR family transcriptional regulator
MGITDRKEREKQELKDLILKVAKEVFLEEGYEKTSIRKIADRIEYSPTTIYLYFKDKNDLLLELHRQSFHQFFQVLSSVMDVADPMERLIATGKKYITYGIQNPEAYELKFLLKSPLEALECKNEIWADGERALHFVQAIVEECIRMGYFDPRLDAESMSILLWSQVHGLVTLSNRNRLDMYKHKKEVSALIEEVFSLFVDFIRSYQRGTKPSNY